MDGIYISQSALYRMRALATLAADGDHHALSQLRGMLDAIHIPEIHRTTEEKFEAIYGKKKLA